MWVEGQKGSLVGDFFLICRVPFKRDPYHSNSSAAEDQDELHTQTILLSCNETVRDYSNSFTFMFHSGAVAIALFLTWGCRVQRLKQFPIIFISLRFAKEF